MLEFQIIFNLLDWKSGFIPIFSEYWVTTNVPTKNVLGPVPENLLWILWEHFNALTESVLTSGDNIPTMLVVKVSHSSRGTSLQ